MAISKRSLGPRKLAGLAIALMLLCATLGMGLRSALAVRRATPRPQAPTAAVAAADAPRKHVADTVHFDLLAKLLADDRRGKSAELWMSELADPDATFRVATQSHPLLGLEAPDFTLLDQSGRAWSLRDRLAGGPVVVVFYLGYFCKACVHDLFELNADLEGFRALGAQVVAISGDPRDVTNQQFEKYGAFDFAVLTDPCHRVAQSFETFSPADAGAQEKLLHGTFIVGRDARVHWVNSGDTPFRVNKALLYELARLENKLPPSRPGTGGE